jgi:hypothetical protein
MLNFSGSVDRRMKAGSEAQQVVLRGPHDLHGLGC